MNISKNARCITSCAASLASREVLDRVIPTVLFTVLDLCHVKWALPKSTYKKEGALSQRRLERKQREKRSQRSEKHNLRLLKLILGYLPRTV